MFRRKNFLLFSIILLLGVAFTLFSAPSHSSALSVQNYTSHLIDDGVFRNPTTMNASAIQAFLNNEGSGLANFSDVENCGSTSGAHYSYYTTYYSCGNRRSAAQIIYDAAQAYGINPRVILATLQKEQSLVTTPNPSSSQLNCAMGYLSCGSGVSGFFNQVDNGTWQFRTDMELGAGNNWWGYTPSSYPCNGSTSLYSTALKGGNTVTFHDFNGTAYNTITLANMSTASLYCYTPHVYNNPSGLYGNPQYGTTGQYFSGSYNFVNAFVIWWGTTYTNPNDYEFVTSSATSLHYNPGDTGSVTVVVQNIGSTTWYSDHNLPGGQQPTRLATAGYQNSPFITPDANSLFTQNQVLMTPDVVAPGQNATFTFDVTGPYLNIAWNHYLVPEVAGAFLENLGIDALLYADTPAWQLTSSSIDTQTPLPNQQSLATFTVLNNSGGTWYSDHNLPGGRQPTRLATVGYKDSPFADTSDPRWLGSKSQIMMTPDAVAPGQTATFQAYFIGPISRTSVTSSFHFFVEVGGVFTQDKGCSFTISTPAANMGYQLTGSGGLPASMTKGSSATATVTLLNTGNVVWQDELFDSGAHAFRLMMNRPNYRNSAFYDSSDANWLTPSQIAKPTGTVWPGQSTTFSFTWLAPNQAGNYYEPFAPIIGGNFMPDDGLAVNMPVN